MKPMAEDDIYGNQARYERFLRNLDSLVLPLAEQPGNRRKSKYVVKNAQNLKYFRQLVPIFEAKDLSFIRRLRLLSEAFRRSSDSCSPHKKGSEKLLTLFESGDVPKALARAAHAKLKPLKGGQDPCQEIVAEFVAATLAALDGRTVHLGTSYEYLDTYAKKMEQSVERAVCSLLGEIEKVLKVILEPL